MPRVLLEVRCSGIRSFEVGGKEDAGEDVWLRVGFPDFNA